MHPEMSEDCTLQSFLSICINRPGLFYHCSALYTPTTISTTFHSNVFEVTIPTLLSSCSPFFIARLAIVIFHEAHIILITPFFSFLCLILFYHHQQNILLKSCYFCLLTSHQSLPVISSSTSFSSFPLPA